MNAGFSSAIVLAAVAGLAVSSARAQATPAGASTVRSAGVVACGAADNDPTSATAAADKPAQPCPVAWIQIGHASRLLTGPWRFHAGDDMRWVAPHFDDLRWETTDLTPNPGAHDSDVGLTDYVPGWWARGHQGYAGYAWYRLHVAVDAPAGASLALLAPAYVEDAYQLFWNGRLIGGSGDFSGRAPIVYSTRPQVFPLPPMVADAREAVLAIRVWMRPGLAREADAGGIHIPPTLGTSEAIDAQYRLQWLQTINGYVVEVAEPVAFVLLAMLAWCFRTALSRGRFAHWLCAALLLNAAFRLNQAVYYWTSYENFSVYFTLYRILPPLGLAAWLMAWRHWYRLERRRWPGYVIGSMTALSVVLVLALHDETFARVSPLWRVPLALLLLVPAVVGLVRRQPDGLLALVVVLLVAVSQFSVEVSALGVPGIWFPFGVGVSRTQYAYAAVIVGLAVLLVRSIQRAMANRAVGRGDRAVG